MSETNITITRTNMRPLAFSGRLIASASTAEHASKPNPDYTEIIEIYHTVGGRYVARSIQSSVGQVDVVEAEVLEAAADLVAYLSDGEEIRTVALSALERAGAHRPEITAALVIQVD